MICRLLGVPREDEPLFRAWSDALVAAADVKPEEDTTETDKAGDQARIEMGGYLVNLAEQRRGKPSDDMLSAFVNRTRPCGSPRRNSRKPPCCSSSRDTRPRST